MVRTRGFTLIELMVVVAIVTLLLAIALPSYSAQIRRATRSEAKTALLEVASAQERFLFSFGSYSSNLAGARGLGRGSGLALSTSTSSGPGDSAFYTISLQVDPGGLAYVASAVPQGTQSADDCGTLQLNHAGQRSANHPDCW